MALCEQMEDPRTAKGVVKREVVRVITPATQLEAEALDAGETSFVMAIDPGPDSLGVAWLEPTTGEFFVAEWDGPARFERLRDELGAMRPRELLVRDDPTLPAWLADPAQPEGAIPRAPVEGRASSRRARARAARPLRRATLEAFGCEDLPRATAAAGAALRYVRDTQKRDLTHVTTLLTRGPADVLVIDALTRRNLELVESQADGDRRARCSTCSTRRRPRWAAARSASGSCARWSSSSASRTGSTRSRSWPSGRGTRPPARGARPRPGPRPDPRPGRPWARLRPRDLVALATSLGRARRRRGARRVPGSPRRLRSKDLDPPLDVAAEIEGTLVDDPPASAARRRVRPRRGRPRARRAARDEPGRPQTIAAIEERERARTGIALAEGALQPRLRLLHRGQQVEPGAGAARLRAQADDRRRRALHHARAEGVRGQGPARRRADPRARRLAIFEALRASVAAARRAASSRPRARSPRSTCWPRLAEVAGRFDYVKPRAVPRRTSSSTSRAATRSWSGCCASLSSPTTSRWATARRASTSSPGRTWAASPPSCARPRSSC